MMIAIPANDVYNLTVAALVIGAAVLWCCALRFCVWIQGRECALDLDGDRGGGGVRTCGDGGGGDGGGGDGG